MVFDYIYDYDFGCILHHDISYLKTLFSSFVAEKMLMSHTILKKTFISDCGREDASCQSLAGEGGAKGTSCRRQRAAHLPRKYPTFAKRRLKYCWSNDFIDIIG